MDEFMEFLADQVLELDNLSITSDFNIHVNDEADQDAKVFMDAMEAIGLDQYVTFTTHKDGNTLNLFFSELQSKVQIIACHEGQFISDHIAVEVITNIPR